MIWKLKLYCAVPRERQERWRDMSDFRFCRGVFGTIYENLRFCRFSRRPTTIFDFLNYFDFKLIFILSFIFETILRFLKWFSVSTIIWLHISDFFYIFDFRYLEPKVEGCKSGVVGEDDRSRDEKSISGVEENEWVGWVWKLFFDKL